MAQYDFGTIDPNTKSGTALATDLNSYRNAVNSMHSGSAAPSYITAGMMWVDTTSANYELKLYDGAQSITVAIIDATDNVARVAVDPAQTSYITSTASGQVRHVIASTNIFTTRASGIQFNIASPQISDSNNNELISFTPTASAVNQIDIANAATGGAVNLSAVGSDTNISIALTPKGDGGVGIGTASPRASLDLTSSILADDYQLLISSLRPNIVFEDTSTSASDFQIYGDAGGLAFLYGDASTNIKLASEAMRITNAGSVGIGTTTPSQVLHVIGNVRAEGANPSFILAENDTTNQDSRIRLNGGVTLFETLNDDGTLNRLNLSISSAGTITIADLAGSGSRTVNASPTGVLSATSDSRLKEEVLAAPLPGLAEIMQLEPRAYKWVDDIEKRGENAAVEIGFFADQVKDIIPSAAPMGNDGYYGFYDRAVIAALTKAVQEQQAIITALEARLNALEAQ